ncbi:uncharacterized protein LOC110726987 [Chenopodium quinoa]|uniref:uncharacterized protein LOC110726987 n=1 Tax=Chenopodium quinoa TaxID=63459 RepID=UPI000B799DE4|nr:uncharacterized protein LOC110726987 [Chenopodium quinoa]
MVQTRSSSKKNTTDTNVEVNRDVAEASNKNTMNQKKRKATAENSILKPIEASKKTTKKVVNARDPYEGEVIVRKMTNADIALDVYMKEYQDEYIKNHPGETKLPREERLAVKKKFRELVKTTKYYIVKKYIKKLKDDEAARYARNPRSERSCYWV